MRGARLWLTGALILISIPNAGVNPLVEFSSDAANPIPAIKNGLKFTPLSLSIRGMGAIEGSSPRKKTPKFRQINSCGTLDRQGATYLLQNDVSAAGSCFSIQANNITLDLNGHLVTYAIRAAQQPRYGILAEACWDTSLAGNPCGGTADHFTVENGTITQGTGAAPYSHAIRIGQINDTNHLVVHDVTFNVHASSSIPVYTSYAGSESAVFDNIVHNDVTSVFNRHQIQGASIKFQNTQAAGTGEKIHDNTIIGGAQGGIYSASFGTQIFNNTISQNGRYSNDFGIYEWGNNTQAYNNTLMPTSGRGIQIGGGAASVNGHEIGSHGAVAHDNKIVVIELQQNCDYSTGGTACNACELGGTYGIQFDDNPSNGVAYKNAVTAKADQCPAQALRLTKVGPGNSSHDNIYVAQRIGSSTAMATGLGFEIAPNHFSSIHDTFIGDTATVWIDWGGAIGGFTCSQCTLGKGTNTASNYVTLSFFNGGGTVKDLRFQDTTFTGGAAKDSTDMRPIDGNHQSAEYFIDWTYTLTVQDSFGNTISGATVTISDALGNRVFNGSTDRDGQISTTLNEFRMFNSASVVTKEMHTPHTVMVSAQKCPTSRSPLTVKIDQTTVQTVQLTCSANDKMH